MKFKTLLLVGLGAVGASASAFDLGATWNFSLNQSVNYEVNIGAWTGSQSTNTALIAGSRDAGAAGGTTTLMPFAPYNFHSYCVEIGETISGGYQTHATVSNLLGSSTSLGGSSGPILFDATRTANLELLWGNFKELVADADDSAAFQLAQWELTFDDDVTLANTSGRFWSVASGDAYTTAENWLTQIRIGSVTDRQGLLLLSGEGIQDLVTPVPEPATIAVLGLGALLLKRKKAA